MDFILHFFCSITSHISDFGRHQGRASRGHHLWEGRVEEHGGADPAGRGPHAVGGGRLHLSQTPPGTRVLDPGTRRRREQTIAVRREKHGGQVERHVDAENTGNCC